MDIRTVPLIHDVKIYAASNVSKERGRKRLADLETRGEIRPLETPTGRRLLTIEDTERLATAL